MGDLLDCLLSAAEELQPVPKAKELTQQNEDERFLEKISTIDPNSLNKKNRGVAKPELNKPSVVHTGDTDSSDDESNKYFENVKYNDFGKSIKHALVPSTSKDRTSAPAWKIKADASAAKPPVRSDVYTDPIFGIRLVNPLISSAALRERMVGREAVPMARLKRHVETLNSDRDWVVAGVVVHKSNPKTSQKGSQFAVWMLSDLHGDLKIAGLFLFGKAYQELWKTTVGTTVGVLNPTVLDKKDGSKDEVCKKFQEVGSKYLSRGFLQVEKRHATIYKKIKALLPRRESERRAHPLARHCDILSAIETRISMLNMTFMKYIENNLCCFIPGKVIDEIERVLTIVEAEGPPPRTHELLQELRDISSMAMEHFEEKILPSVKLQIEQPPIIPLLPSTSKSSKVIILQYAIAEEVRKVRKQNKFQKVQIKSLMDRLERFNRKIQRQNVTLKVQSAKIRDQERKLQEQSNKMQEQDSTIADIKKHMDEWGQKFSDLTAEVRAREDFNTGKSPNKQPPVEFHMPNIKPRKAQVLPKACNAIIKIEMERKRKANAASEVPHKLPRNLDAKDDKVGNLTDILQNYKNKAPNEGRSTMTTRRSGIGTFISSSFESLLKNPITSIKSRKRKINEVLELDN